MNFDAANWLAYREANMRFADVVAGFCSAGDMVWVQDYHLMLLPMLLRSMISGEAAQGEMVRRELGRVKKGVDDDVVKEVLGMEQGVAKGIDEGVEMLDDVEEEGDPLTLKSSKPIAGVGGMVSPPSASGASGVVVPPAGAAPSSSSSGGARKRPGMARGMSAFQQQEMVAKSRGKEGIRIGFFLHTPFPSSEIYR